MADPVNGLLAARMDPERRRRIGNALLAYQYDRETPQDAAVTERAGLFPLATYANGQTGIAWPGIVATPVEKMAQVLRGEITPGTPEFNEAGFDIAGAAMVGGLAAARPKTPPQPLIGYRGSPFEGGHTRNHFWASADRGMAGDYAMVPGNDKNPRHAPNVTPAEFRFKNPLTINAKGDYWDYIKRDGLRTSTDGLADDALFAGHDGIIIKNVVDPVGNASQLPQTTIAALQRGTVYSPLTGDLLYANARPGAALGAGLSGASERQGIRAYHGSPHDFDRFDMSKIGTGEGKQAYGHGLYFAEHEGVAKGYRDKLVDRTNFVRPDGSTWDPFTSLEHVNVRSMAGRGDIDAAIAKAKEIVASNSPVAGHAQRDLEKLINIQSTGGIKPNPGRMYEVNIKANPDDFLDWDKPLSQQSEKVRGAIQAFDPEMSPSLRDKYTGQTFMRDYSGYVSDGYAKSVPEVSQALRDAGIPGIKYLDQGSRDAGEGSRNYVVFDANLIEILRKYGLLGMLGAGGMAQELMKPSKPNIPDDAA